AAPVIRAANSALRSPAKTRCAWESTNPGTTERPSQSITSSAAGASAAGPVQATRPASTTSAASSMTANEPGPDCTGPGSAGPGCTGPGCTGPGCTGPGCTGRVLASGAFVTSSPMLVISVLTGPHASRPAPPRPIQDPLRGGSQPGPGSSSPCPSPTESM